MRVCFGSGGVRGYAIANLLLKLEKLSWVEQSLLRPLFYDDTAETVQVAGCSIGCLIAYAVACAKTKQHTSVLEKLASNFAPKDSPGSIKLCAAISKLYCQRCCPTEAGHEGLLKTEDEAKHLLSAFEDAKIKDKFEVDAVVCVRVAHGLKQKTLRLNGKEKKQVNKILRAAIAIPVLFEPVQIDMDGRQEWASDGARVCSEPRGFIHDSISDSAQSKCFVVFSCLPWIETLDFDISGDANRPDDAMVETQTRSHSYDFLGKGDVLSEYLSRSLAMAALYDLAAIEASLGIDLRAHDKALRSGVALFKLEGPAGNIQAQPVPKKQTKFEKDEQARYLLLVSPSETDFKRYEKCNLLKFSQRDLTAMRLAATNIANTIKNIFDPVQSDLVYDDDELELLTAE